MKIQPLSEHNRTLVVSDLPEIKITINYVGDAVEKAVILDNVIIPHILRCAEFANAYNTAYNHFVSKMRK